MSDAKNRSTIGLGIKKSNIDSLRVKLKNKWPKENLLHLRNMHDHPLIFTGASFSNNDWILSVNTVKSRTNFKYETKIMILLFVLFAKQLIDFQYARIKDSLRYHSPTWIHFILHEKMGNFSKFQIHSLEH